MQLRSSYSKMYRKSQASLFVFCARSKLIQVCLCSTSLLFITLRSGKFTIQGIQFTPSLTCKWKHENEFYRKQQKDSDSRLHHKKIMIVQGGEVLTVCFQCLEDKLSISILKFITSCLNNLYTKWFPQHPFICTGHVHPAHTKASLSNTAF